MSYDDEDDLYGGYESDDDLDDVGDDFDSDDDSDVTIACRYCGADMYDDAEQCPHCGQYLSTEDAPHQGKPWWIVVVVVLCLVSMLWWIVAGL